MIKFHSDYLDFRWRIKSAQIKARDNHQCQICGKKHNLNVHHIVYENGWKIWDYPGYYLITLCEFHHGLEHAYLEFINANKYKEQLLSGLLAHDILKRDQNWEENPF